VLRVNIIFNILFSSSATNSGCRNPFQVKMAAETELRNFVAVNAQRAFFRARLRKVEIKFRKAWF